MINERRLSSGVLFISVSMAITITTIHVDRAESSAIPMWEYLSKDEKMSYLYSMFANQVEEFCNEREMRDCNRNLMRYGLGKLRDMPEDHLDVMDPYQRGANTLIWDSMMEGHEMMMTKNEKHNNNNNNNNNFRKSSTTSSTSTSTKSTTSTTTSRPALNAHYDHHHDQRYNDNDYYNDFLDISSNHHADIGGIGNHDNVRGEASAKIETVAVYHSSRLPPPPRNFQITNGPSQYHHQRPSVSVSSLPSKVHQNQQNQQYQQNQQNQQNQQYQQQQQQQQQSKILSKVDHDASAYYDEHPLTGPMVVRVHLDGSPVVDQQNGRRQPNQRLPLIDEDLRQYRMSKVKIPTF